MDTLDKVKSSRTSLKRIMEIQQSLYVRDERNLPTGAIKPTLAQLNELFHLLYEADNDLRLAEHNLTFL